MTIKQGLPTFSFMAEESPKVAKIYEKELVCEKHGKYKASVIEYSDESEETGKCPKCEEERQLAIKEAEKERLREAEYKFEIEHGKELNILPEYYHAKLEDYKVVTKAQGLAKSYVEELIENRSGKVVLIGANGTGKTMLGSIAVKAMGGKYYTLNRLTNLIKECYSVKATRTENEIIDELSNIPFLVIDEIGRSKNSEAAQNWLSDILNYRHSSNLPFMLIGNLHLRKDCKVGGCNRCFDNFFDNDVLSRLTQNTKIAVFKQACDFRRNTQTCVIGTDD